MNHLISTLLAFGPYISSLIWNCKPEIIKKRAEFGQRPKKSWKTRAKNRTNRGKNQTNRAKNAETQTFQIFHVCFFSVQILNCHFFVKSDHAWILYLLPCHRIIFECEIIVWGWEPVRSTRLSANRTPALWFWHCWLQGGCRILWDILGKFLLGFLKYAPPYPCHSRCENDFNTIEPALFA